MHRVGIGGFQLVDVTFGSGQTVDSKIDFMTDPWLDAVRHSAAEADRLGLEMSIFSSAGWSETGGPWVKPEQAMKKLVWSETTVQGPRAFNEKLPQPPTNNGPIRNLATGGGRTGAPRDPTFYADAAVLAFPTPADESQMAEKHPKVTSSGGDVDGEKLMDDDLNSAVSIAPPQEGPAWVQYEFAEPFTAQAVTIEGRGGIPVGRVCASDDGKDFHTLVELPGAQLYRGGLERTFAFAPATAKFFRVEMTAAPLGPAITMSQDRPQSAAQYALGEFVLSSGARVNRWEEKSGFSFLYDYKAVPTPAVPASDAVAQDKIIDLTSKMAKDGTLQCDLPAGRWTILRLGYSLTGAKNRPAGPTGLGYEVDKLSREHVESYFHGYTDPLAKALGPMWGKSLRYMTMDSWEAGMQNWTDQMIDQFKQRRGYDPTPYLPALTGHIIGSAEISDRFLWDFRRTLADMFAENHYGTMADLLHKQGIGLYAEAAGVSMEVIEDTLLNKKFADIPMGEFWVRALHPELQYYVDVRGAASAAHVYGKKIVATESFTGGGYESPYTLKRVADYWFAQGVNRLVFHTSAHQPIDTKPGNTMVGTHINRNITWAEQAGPFMAYLSRTSYMLQQGVFVADLAYLLPEGAPSSQPFWGGGLKPPPPGGYDYDCINTDVLLNRISVDADGRLVLPDGMSYRVLVLPQTDRMTPRVLRKIRDLVAGGATIVGPKPVASPSLEGYPQADEEVRSLANEVWGDLDGVMRNRRFYGKGIVIWGMPLETALPVPKDFEFTGPFDTDLAWIHRRAGEADFYFIANRTDRPLDVDVRCRVEGREAELWHLDSGAVEPAGYLIESGRTIVPLHLDERESVFVVFRKPTTTPSRELPRRAFSTVATVSGPWKITFPPKLGAPDSVDLASLQSWATSDDPGVKYFSGTATYTTALHDIHPTGRTFLDLGNVNDLAELVVNGKSLGIVWKPPYRVDITDALKHGDNELQIKVTNEWTNRLAGDRSLPADKKILTPIQARPGAAGGNQPLPQSGLIGPVKILSTSESP
jgi:hypothetical protein